MELSLTIEIIIRLVALLIVPTAAVLLMED